MFKRLALALVAALSCASAHAQQASQVPPAEVCFTGAIGQNGVISTLGIPTPGNGGVDGTYSVSLLGGSGTGAIATVIVFGGGVTSETVSNPGQGYAVGDVLTASPSALGGVLGYSTTVSGTAISGALAGGSVAFYVPATTTLKSTWKNAAQTTLNTNPITLDGNGCALIYGNGSYRQVVKDNIGNTVWDQVVQVAPVNPYWSGTAAGTANALTLQAPQFTGSDGQELTFIVNTTNTGAATITPSGTGTSASVVKNSATGPVALVKGDLTAGNVGLVTYSTSLNGFVLINPANANTASAYLNGAATYVTPYFCSYSTLNGTTPDDACVQAAITSACSTVSSPTGIAPGTLVFSTGAYYIKYGVQIPKSCSGLVLEGQGMGNRGYNANAGTYIVSDNNCTGPIINFYSDATANYVYGGGVNNMAFANNPYGGAQDGTVSCKQPLINVNYGDNMIFHNLYAWQPFQFIKITGGLHDEINFALFDTAIQASPGVFEFKGTGDIASDSATQATRQDQIKLVSIFGGSGNVTTGNSPFTGIWWHGFSNTLNLDNIGIEGASAGLKIDCTGGGATDISACPAFLQTYDLEVEGGYNSASNLVDAQDFQNLIFTDSYFHCFSTVSGKCANSMKFYNGTFNKSANVKIKGGQADSGQFAGINSEIQNLNVIGMSLFNNNLGGAGGADIYAQSPVGSDLHNQINIENNMFCFNDGNSFSENPIVLSSGIDYIIAIGNNFYGCGGGIINNSGGAHVTISPNVGP